MSKKILARSQFDRAHNIFLAELKSAAATKGIVLGKDAIVKARNTFVQTCLNKGIPDSVIAKAAGQRYISLMLGEKSSITPT